MGELTFYNRLINTLCEIRMLVGSHANHAPWTLNPAPCTLHPAPCTLHPAPCTLHPAPCTLNPFKPKRLRGSGDEEPLHVTHIYTVYTTHTIHIYILCTYTYYSYTYYIYYIRIYVYTMHVYTVHWATSGSIPASNHAAHTSKSSWPVVPQGS